MFEVTEQLMKAQLKVESFDEFGLPVQDCVRIVGRIVNLSTEDAILNENSVGLFSLGDSENAPTVYRLKLNLSEVQSYSLFEGEVVVAEGFNDSNSRFNVNRLHKPQVIPPKELHEFETLKTCHEMQQGKAIQTMVASGPFSSKVNLCYDSLQDLMGLVRRDQPHVLILLGPFCDTQNEDIKEGIISYRDTDGQLDFLEYQELFRKI